MSQVINLRCSLVRSRPSSQGCVACYQHLAAEVLNCYFVRSVRESEKAESRPTAQILNL